MFSAYYLIRLMVGLSLPDLPLTVPRWYLPFTGALWSVVGLVAAYALLKGRSWAAKYTRVATLAFIVWYWIDRLVLIQTDYAVRSLPFAAALSLLGAGFILWGLNRTHTRAYFGETSS